MNDDPEARKRWGVGVDSSPTSHHALRSALAPSQEQACPCHRNPVLGTL